MRGQLIAHEFENIAVCTALARKRALRYRSFVRQAVFARLAGGLVRAQDAADGRWHQVLDEPSTFLETSATAMFTFALATGVVEGWLPRAQYEAPVRAAWAGLLRAVREDGTVDGICQGTPVELDVAAYNSRSTLYNMSDPGLGAVFRAAMAMQRYNAQAEGGGSP